MVNPKISGIDPLLIEQLKSSYANVAVIDSNELYLEVIRDLLLFVTANAVAIGCKESFSDSLKDDSYDLYFVDIECCEYSDIYNQLSQKDAKVVFTFSSKKEKQIFEQGCSVEHKYIQKPFNIKKLLKLLSSL